MEGTVRGITKIAALFTILGLLIAGCGKKTNQSKKSLYENQRFVPSFHVEDKSFL